MQNSAKLDKLKPLCLLNKHMVHKSAVKFDMPDNEKLYEYDLTQENAQ